MQVNAGGKSRPTSRCASRPRKPSRSPRSAQSTSSNVSAGETVTAEWARSLPVRTAFCGVITCSPASPATRNSAIRARDRRSTARTSRTTRCSSTASTLRSRIRQPGDRTHHRHHRDRTRSRRHGRGYSRVVGSTTNVIIKSGTNVFRRLPLRSLRHRLELRLSADSTTRVPDHRVADLQRRRRVRPTPTSSSASLARKAVGQLRLALGDRSSRTRQFFAAVSENDT